MVITRENYVYEGLESSEGQLFQAAVDSDRRFDKQHSEVLKHPGTSVSRVNFQEFKDPLLVFGSQNYIVQVEDKLEYQTAMHNVMKNHFPEDKWPYTFIEVAQYTPGNLEAGLPVFSVDTVINRILTNPWQAS